MIVSRVVAGRGEFIMASTPGSRLLEMQAVKNSNGIVILKHFLNMSYPRRGFWQMSDPPPGETTRQTQDTEQSYLTVGKCIAKI